MWQLINGVQESQADAAVDREPAIGGTGKVSVPEAAFTGTLATAILAAPRSGV